MRRELVDRIGRHVLVTLAALTAVACATGGGGGTSSTNTGADATPAGPTVTSQQQVVSPPPPPPPPGPSATASEFTTNYVLGAIHADVAYTAGASGAGVTVAVIDTGVDGSGSELQGRVSSLSLDENNLRNTPVGTDTHATYVAGVIAANFNGSGTIGVAYNSTVLSVRADTTGVCNGETCISSTYVAQGIDYAIAHGVKVVNLSFGTNTGSLGSTFEQALVRGVNAGLVFTIAAGNEAGSSPDWPAMYATDPRFAGSIIAVGATAKAGGLASFSNAAGSAMNYFMTAPGASVVSCVTGTCATIQGTSFSAPAVAGSLALLLQAFPDLTPKQAVQLLLQTADDLGTSGTDTTYGVGGLDLTRAFQPIGTMSVSSAKGSTMAVNTVPGSFVSSAVGDAIVRSGALQTVGRDSYNRLFKVDMAQGYRPSSASIIAPDPAEQLNTSNLDVPSFANGRLKVRANLSSGQLDPADHFHWMLSQGHGGDLTVSYERAGFAVSAWKSGGGTNPFGPFGGATDAFVSIAQPNAAVQAAFAHKSWRFSAEAGGGQRLSLDHTRIEDGASYARAAVEQTIGRVALSLGGGELVEPQGPLGSYLPSRSGYELPSKTGFVSSTMHFSLMRGVDFNGQASVGRTKLVGQFLQTTEPAWSSSWRMSLDANCHAIGLGCTGLHLSLSQPLRIEGGNFTAVLPVAPQDVDDPLTFSTRTFSAAPSGREMDLRLVADRDIGRWGTVSLQGVVARQPANIAYARPAAGVVAGWRMAF